MLSLKSAAFGLEGEKFRKMEYSIDEVLNFYREFSEEDLHSLSERNAVKMFHKVVQNVPAYRDFLYRKGIDSKEISSFSDFQKLPILDKKNYLREYPLADLCWGGELQKANFVSSSSGSTGKPFFWPRSIEDEIETSLYHEIILENAFEISNRKTLLVVCYGLGIYVGGTYTINALNKIAERNYDLNIVSPGIEMDNVLMAVEELIDCYDQTVFLGYPPFVKDVLEKGQHELGIKWKEHNLGFFFSSENFSEEFRQYILEYVGDGSKDRVVSMYACSDLAVIGHSSTITSEIREKCIGDESMQEALFNEPLIPSLHQYNPLSKFVEQIDNELVISSLGAIPLIRYNLHDRGDVVSYSDFMNKFRETHSTEELSLESEVGNLPFVYLFGRSDLTSTLYGVNIYPENIKKFFLNYNDSKVFTGKFTMQTDSHSNQDQFLLVTFEIAEEVELTDSFKSDVKHVLINTLRRQNKEFCRLEEEIDGKAEIQIRFSSSNNNMFQPNGLKQTYVVT